MVSIGLIAGVAPVWMGRDMLSYVYGLRLNFSAGATVWAAGERLTS